MSLRYHIDATLRRLEKQFETHNRIAVSQSALLHNAELFTRLSGVAVMPVLKGNAYGHGTEVVARALRGRRFPYVAVDGYFEALKVRNVSRQPVLIMGAIAPGNFRRMRYDGFAFAVQHAATIRALGETGRRVAVHLEVNTGMNRYGVRPDAVPAMVELIRSYPNLRLEGVMSHLADPDGDDPSTVESAVALFDSAVGMVRAAGADPQWCHVSQTAGSVVAVSRTANAMRLGIGLYGINPFDPAQAPYGRLTGLRPALRLMSTVTNVVAVAAGEGVSYNYTFTAPRAMRVGIIPLGYYEGLPRLLSGRGVVMVGGAPCPVVGRICMNHTLVDLSATDAGIGASVVVVSDDPADANSVAGISRAHGMFPYSLLTGLNGEVRRKLEK